MAADEEHGVIESRLEGGDLRLDEAEAAQEVVLGDEVREGDALREQVDEFDFGLDSLGDILNSETAVLWAGLPELVHGWRRA
jgi:hypothetical protein